MRPEAKAILTDPGLVRARDAHFAGLRRVFAGEAPARPFVSLGEPGAGKSDPYSEPERWVDEALDDLAAKAERLRDEGVFRPPVIEFGPYGVHFIDRMFGAGVLDLGGGNWQARPLRSPVGGLVPPDLERDPTWALARRVADAFVESGTTVPLFGMPTIASALNIAVNLYGERLLAATVEDPEAVARDLGVVNDVLREMHSWYIANVPAGQLQPVVAAERAQPPGSGQLCGCTTQLLSPGRYRDLVAPLDDALLSMWPEGGMIHLCGAHAQHCDAWRDMKPLRAVQLNDRAAEDIETYLRDLRDDQVIYVNPTSTVTPERVTELTGGRRVVIVADVDPGKLAG